MKRYTSLTNFHEELLFECRALTDHFLADDAIGKPEDLFGVFEQTFTSYEDYAEYLTEYREFMKEVENIQRMMKTASRQHMNIPTMYNPVRSYQSAAALMANALTRLLFVRSSARIWRRMKKAEAGEKIAA